MTLFIKCLLPIKIEKWGQGRKKRQKLIYFLRLSLKFGLKFLGSFIIIVGKIGLANIPSWGFPFRLFTSIFVGIGLVYITRIPMQNSQRFFFFFIFFIWAQVWAEQHTSRSPACRWSSRRLVHSGPSEIHSSDTMSSLLSLLCRLLCWIKNCQKESIFLSYLVILPKKP